MKKKLPIGIENFKEFVQEGFYYVDKTMFIAELLHNMGKVNLFTRPRRFGKSLNMGMLKTFFEIGCNKSLFDGLKITLEKDLCQKYMGEFPVISVSLKGVEGSSFKEAGAALRNIIGKEALRFEFLLQSDRLSAREKKMYSQLVAIDDGTASIFHMSDSVLIDSLQTLTQVLSRHYDRPVILLIDEYDVPLAKAFQAGYYNEMVSLLRSLFGNALKTNEYLFTAVLTGCLRISKESIFTGLNNLQTHTIADRRYDEYFGFTEEEVQKLLAYYGLENFLETMRDWYDGYRFGNVSIYCPWDVINYCYALLADPDAPPENYWANTSGNDTVKRFIGKANHQTREEIEQLVAGESILKSINQELTYSELDTSIENLWSVLFTTGYLTPKGRTAERKFELAIPNREIRDLFVKQIQEWFKEETRGDSGKLEKFCHAFLQGDREQIEALLNGYLWKSISIRDTAVRKEKKELFFHGMLLGLLEFEDDWAIASNVESGNGYGDILIRTPQRIGIVIEVKYAESGNLEKGCANALAQIENRKYDAILISDGMKEIRKYGIAFYKKQCKVALG